MKGSEPDEHAAHEPLRRPDHEQFVVDGSEMLRIAEQVANPHEDFPLRSVDRHEPKGLMSCPTTPWKNRRTARTYVHSNSCSTSMSGIRPRSPSRSWPASGAKVRSGGSHGPTLDGARNSSLPGASMRCETPTLTRV